MADLSDYRREIDAIDAQLIPLFEQRMDVVRKVAAYKKEHRMQVLQAGREQQVIEQAVARLRDPDYAGEAAEFMKAVMAISRAAQRKDLAQEPREASELPLTGQVGYYGAPGSFTDEASFAYFGETRVRRPYAEFEDVFKALRDGEIDYGVLPIENSSTGAITRVYDLLGSYGFYIVGEQRLKICQNLVGIPGTTLDSIRTIYSHAQGIEQSSRFLAQHPDWAKVPFHSTSISASRVAEEGSTACAAIASERAAALYGLKVIVPDIQDSSLNATRFIVIGRELTRQPGADKVSLAFSLDHESGTLYHTLRYFAESHINLVKIESRPIPETLWHYRFYLDFEGDLDSDEVQSVLAKIAQGAKDYRVLGAYKSDPNVR